MRVFVLGDGEKVINQYPSDNTSLYKDSVVVLLTNNYNKAMPNLVGLSYKDAYNILELMGVKYRFEGNGYVVSQSIIDNAIVNDSDEVIVTLSK